jgi:hypothetical protein
MKNLSNFLFSIALSLSAITLLPACNSNPPIQETPDFAGIDLSLPRFDLTMSMSEDMSSPGDMSPPIGTECKRNDECAGLALCDPRLGRCVECRVSDDCAANASCQSSHCIAATACTSDITCKPVGQLCDTKNGRCVDCNSSADCPGNDPKRLPNGTACLGHSCVPTRSCMSTLECSGALVCAEGLPPTWPGDFMGKGCTECGSTADCPTSEGCQASLCVKSCLKSGRKCGMIDDAVCGSCPGASDTCSDRGIACMSDAGTFLSLDYFEALAINKDSVFVAIRNMTSSIYKLDRAAGTSKLAALVSGYVNGLALNSTHVVYPASEKVFRLPLAGGAAQLIYTNSGTDQCYDLVADDTNFYCALNGSSIVQIPLAGGTPIQLTDSTKSLQIDQMFVRKDKLFYGATGSVIGGATIGYAPIGGGTVQVLASGQASGPIFADDTYVYYSTMSGVFRVAIAGGTSETLATASTYSITALDNGMLYLLDGNGNILRLDLTTRKLDTLLTDKDPRISAVRADGNKLFGWTGTRIKQVNLL